MGGGGSGGRVPRLDGTRLTRPERPRETTGNAIGGTHTQAATGGQTRRCFTRAVVPSATGSPADQIITGRASGGGRVSVHQYKKYYSVKGSYIPQHKSVDYLIKKKNTRGVAASIMYGDGTMRAHLNHRMPYIPQQVNNPNNPELLTLDTRTQMNTHR